MRTRTYVSLIVSFFLQLSTASATHGITPPINQHGFWEGECEHMHDRDLALGIIAYLKEHQVRNIVDFGCGNGSYIHVLKDAGFDVTGFDGNPATSKITGGLASTLDLAVPQNLGKQWDYVMSLEVGEHLPQHFEDIFIDNIHKHNAKGVILSWAVPGQGGHGHFNERDNEYIKEKFRALGYKNNKKAEEFLRKYSTLWWFKNTVMVFEKE